MGARAARPQTPTPPVAVLASLLETADLAVGALVHDVGLGWLSRHRRRPSDPERRLSAASEHQRRAPPAGRGPPPTPPAARTGTLRSGSPVPCPHGPPAFPLAGSCRHS